jgi:phage-related protein
MTDGRARLRVALLAVAVEEDYGQVGTVLGHWSMGPLGVGEGRILFVVAILVPAALEAIRAFPDEVRQKLGKAIFDLQRGDAPGMPLSRPMPSIAAGVAELRVRDRAGVFRAFYYTRSARGILVLHAFLKKTQTTPKQDLELGKKRLREMLDEEN